MRKFTAIALAVPAILLPIQYANAAGYQLFEQSVSGLGRAYAGDGAIADNSSAITYNPALATQFKKSEFSLGATFIIPKSETKQEAISVFPTYKTKDEIPEQIVPNFSVVAPISDHLSAGISVFSNYGESVKHKEGNALTDLLGGDTTLRTVTFNPSVAFKINDAFSVGFGVSAVRADAELKRRMDVIIGQAKSATGDVSFKMKGDDWGYGYNFGMTYQPDENNRWGLSYRSQVDIKFKGDFEQAAPGVTYSSMSTSGSLEVPLPAMAIFSGMTKLNPQWMVSYSVAWTQWSAFKKLEALSAQCSPSTSPFSPGSGVCFRKNEDFRDNFRYSIGATYKAAPKWTFRSGIALDKQAGESTLSLPDTDRYWFSGGATYTATDNFSIDIGLTYLVGGKSTYSENLAGVGNVQYVSNSSAWLAGAQLNYRF